MTWERTMTEALLRGSDRELYVTNEFFRGAVDQLVAMLPSFIDGLAATSEIQLERMQREAYHVMTRKNVVSTPIFVSTEEFVPAAKVLASHNAKPMERQCECEEPSFSTDPKPVEAWWRCKNCRGLLWMGSYGENMEKAPFRWPNLNEWVDNHPDAEVVPIQFRPEKMINGWLQNSHRQFFVDTNGRIRRGPVVQ